MSGLKAYVADLPESALEYIASALEVYGVGQVKVEELDLVNNNSSKLTLRMSTEDNSVINVILGEVGYERGKAFEKNLYSNKKFHRYIDDRSLVLYLNDAHDAGLEVPEVPVVDIALSYSDEQQGLDESYNTDSSNPSGGYAGGGYRNDGALLLENRELYNTIAEKDRLILELESEDVTVVDEEQIGLLNKQITKLESIKEQYKAKITTLQSEKNTLTVKFEASEKNSTAKEEQIVALKGKISSLDIKLLDFERQKTRIDSQAEELKLVRENLSAAHNTIRELNEINSGLSKTLTNVHTEVNKKSTEVAEITRLRTENNVLDGEKQKAEESLQEALKKIEAFKKYDDEIHDKFEAEKATALTKIREEYEAELASRATIIQNYINEKAELNKEHTPEVDSGAIENIANYESSIFYQISNKALPHSTLPKLEIGSTDYKNITFVFSGARVSATETMKHIRDSSYSTSKSGTGGVIVVDISNNTDTDYIFGGQRNVDGVPWAEGKISFRDVLKKPSSNETIRYFSLAGKGYLNDSYILNIDWATRLRELENSGHKIIIYAGCISDLVGRILFNTFYNKATTRVYVLGRLVNMREAIFNLSGFKHSERVTLHIYDFLRTSSSEAILKTLEKIKYIPVIDSEKQGNK